MNHNSAQSNVAVLHGEALCSDSCDWFPTFKKDYRILVKMVSAPTEVHNYLEDIHYVANSDSDVVLKGTLGEEWVNQFSNVAATYTKPDGSEITLMDFSARDQYIDIKTISSRKYFACFIPFKYNMAVCTAGGDPIHVNREGIDHGQGDYLVCAADKNGKPDLANVWGGSTACNLK